MQQHLWHSEWIAFRYVFAILGCFGIIILFTMRLSMGIAIVAMVKSNTDNQSSNQIFAVSNTTSKNISQYIYNETDNTLMQQIGEFDWSESTRGMIVGAYFWGSIVSQIPCSRLAEHFSGKWVFGISILFSSILYSLIPMAARFNFWCVIAIRVLQGLIEGPTFPVIQSLLSNWAPINDRTKLTTILYSGTTLGIVAILPVSSYLIEYGIFGGWPSLFYISGIMSLIWFPLWSFLVYDNAEIHPCISPKEREYIINNIRKRSKEKKSNLPWKHIITSLPLWAITFSHVCHYWGGNMMILELPAFLKFIMHFDIKKISEVCSLPFLASWFMAMFASYLCDFLIKKQIFSRTLARKIFNFTGHFLPGIAFIAMPFVVKDETLLIVLIVLLNTLYGATYAGFFSNHIDISPYYAGTLMGITNTIATLPGFLCPLIVSVLTNEETLQEWSYTFYLTAGIYFFSAIFYCIFGSGEEQDWN